jgi:hypothetical protein
MKQFLIKIAHYSLLQKNNFLVSLLLIGDITSAYYLLAQWKLKQSSLKMVQLVWQKKGIDFSELSSTEMNEFIQMIDKTLGFTLFTFILANTIIYLFYWKGKKWATTYVKSYCAAGLMVSLVMIVEGFTMPWYLQMLNFLGILIYAVVTTTFYFGPHSQKKEQ